MSEFSSFSGNAVESTSTESHNSLPPSPKAVGLAVDGGADTKSKSSFFGKKLDRICSMKEKKAALGHIAAEAAERTAEIEIQEGRAVELSQVELQNFNKMFDIFDADGSGTIDLAEIDALMIGLGCPMSQEELEQLMQEVDADNSKELDRNEFFSLMRRFKRIKGEVELMATANRAEHMCRAVKNLVPPFTILPDSKWKWCWDLLMLGVTFYYGIIASPIQWVDVDDWGYDTDDRLPVEVTLTIIMFIDMVFHCRTLSGSGTNQLMTSQTLLSDYVNSKRFKFDVISSLPFDILLYSMGMKTAGNIIGYLRLCRLLTIEKLWGGRASSTQISKAFIKFHFDYVPNIKMAFWCLLCVHWLTCGWLVVCQSSEETKYHEKLRYYHTSFYWVLYTVVTTGYGDVPVITKAQHAYACFVIALGAVFNAVLIGRLTGELLRPNVATNGHTRLRMTLEVLQFLEVPPTLQEDILSFLAHSFESDVQAFDHLFDSLPTTMRSNLDLHLKIKCLSPVGIFAYANEECKIDAASKLMSVVYAPDEFVVVSGQVADSLYLISHGFCDVVKPKEGYEMTIRMGDYFGEKELLLGGAFNRSIKTLSYTELYQLSRTSFEEVLQNFPGFKEEIERVRKEAGPLSPSLSNSKHSQGDAISVEKSESATLEVALMRHTVPPQDASVRSDSFGGSRRMSTACQKSTKIKRLAQHRGSRTEMDDPISRIEARLTIQSETLKSLVRAVESLPGVKEMSCSRQTVSYDECLSGDYAPPSSDSHLSENFYKKSSRRLDYSNPLLPVPLSPIRLPGSAAGGKSIQF